MIEMVDQMVLMQRRKLLSLARLVLPGFTGDDLLQPQDFPELESDPEFRYEEGILHGMESVLAALRAK